MEKRRKRGKGKGKKYHFWYRGWSKNILFLENIQPCDLIWIQNPGITGSGSTKKGVVKNKAVDPDPREHGKQAFIPINFTI